MKKIDVIIIGSGLSGLVCASLLSKSGLNVCVLEKNRKAGGLLQNYTSNGHRFDTGLHYISGLDDGQLLNRLFKFLEIFDKIKLHKLDKNGFDIVNLNGVEYPFAMGYDNFVNKLAEIFPDEKSNLTKYTIEIKKIQDSFKLFLDSENSNYNFLFENEYLDKSAYEFIQSITKNKTLQNILSSNISLFAGKKNKTSLYLYGLISSLFIESSYKVIGGGDSIVNALKDIIIKNRGEIITNSEVEELITENGKIKFIQLKNKKLLEADIVISSIHPSATLDLVNDKLIRKSYRNRISEIENTVSAFSLDIILKNNFLKNINYNYYKYSVDNVWDIAEYSEETWPNCYMIHVPSCNIGKEYVKNLTIVSFMDKKHFNNIEYKSKDYILLKQKYSKKLLEFVENDFPNITQNIECISASSPYTFQDFNNSVDGSLYGMLKDYSNPLSTFIHPRTKISNLLLTGQNIAFHGIFGVIISAILTSGEILDLNKILKDIKDV